MDNFSLRNIADYRSQLMGLAIIGVLVGHIISFGKLKDYEFMPILTYISSTLHTSGFLFLSGFGLYYSLSKDQDIKRFYKRRFYRFVLPFLILAIPYFALVDIHGQYGLLKYIGQITTISFWLSGNYHGMWYIAISLFLYVIFPVLYRFLSLLKTFKINWILIILLSLFINKAVLLYFPETYAKIGIGIDGIPYFFVGVFFASIVNLNRIANFSIKEFAIVLILFVINLIIGLQNISPISSRIISLCFWILFFASICKLFSYNHTTGWLNNFFAWFGKYSLELYLLHIYFWFIVKNMLNLGPLLDIVVAVCLSICLSVPIHFFINKISEFIRKKD